MTPTPAPRAHAGSSKYLCSAKSGIVALTIALTLTCSGPSNTSVFTLTPPPATDFEPVSAMLEIHCGTYNCHGQPARNMRIFGIYGARIDRSLDIGFGATTEEEITANYESIISLQPEILSRIAQARGVGAADWMVISKGRGVTHHKGGARLVPGAPNDTCLLSWLAGAIDVTACEMASAVVPPAGADW